VIAQIAHTHYARYDSAGLHADGLATGMTSRRDSIANGARALASLLGRSVAARTGTPTGAADFAPARFSTCELPERNRLPRWREEFGRGVARVDIEPLSDVPFRAEATLRALPGLRTIVCTGSPVRNRRTPAQAADGDNCIGLFVNLGKTAAIAQRGRDVELGRGDAVLISHEPSVVTPSPDGFLGVIVPYTALASRARYIDDATMRLIPQATEALQLLKNYMRSLPKNPILGSPKLRRTVVNHVYDLVALALGPHRCASERGVSAIAVARLAAALGHITQSFEDPRLTVTAVAARQWISPRYLHHLLETTGISFTARVNELRLQRAFTLLTARDGTSRISDIALQAGFSDISHFNRLFRSRFGDTPSVVRAEGRAAQLTGAPR
jgi:AraC-like DNA-binding protein